MRIEENIVKLEDDIVIRQDDRKIILEKGDRIKILLENIDTDLSSINFLYSKGYKKTSSALPNNYTLLPTRKKCSFKELLKTLSRDNFSMTKSYVDILENKVFVFRGSRELSDSYISITTLDGILIDSVSISHQKIGD
jgi:hypothetical protein